MVELYRAVLQPYIDDGGKKQAEALMKDYDNRNAKRGLLMRPVSGVGTAASSLCRLLTNLTFVGYKQY